MEVKDKKLTFTLLLVSIILNLLVFISVLGLTASMHQLKKPQETGVEVVTNVLTTEYEKGVDRAIKEIERKQEEIKKSTQAIREEIENIRKMYESVEE